MAPLEASKRHQLLWDLCYHPVKLYMRLRYHYRPKVQPVKQPSLIVSNHVTDLDPLFLALTVRHFSYFVASEHVFRRPRLAKLLRWAMDPIPRMKSDSGGDAAMAAIRRLRKGFRVALFPEANRTFNGVTSDIIESTAKLARISGASLVTHRLRGGYLTSPRWSGNSLRRGRFTGEVVRVIGPEQLRAMKPEEIAAVIREDIYENAYETQEQWDVPYRGKNLAESIERVVCICPRCEALGTIRSSGDTFSCTGCGLTGRYTEKGWLEGEGLPFRSVLAWDRWQAEKLQALADAAGDGPMAADDGIELCELDEQFTESNARTGTLRAYRDRFELAGARLFFRDISGIVLNGPQTIEITARGKHFTLKSSHVRNMRKYRTLYHAVMAPEKLLSL